MKRVLLIEDEEAIRGFIEINLKRYGYTVLQVGNAEDGIQMLEQGVEAVDLILLDVMLPGMDGFEACKVIRSLDESIGIIMLTAKVQDIDKVHGLMNGADDYISKPFSPNELIARIEALFRRMSVQEKKTPVRPPVYLDEHRRMLIVNGENVDLSPIEYDLLAILMKANGKAISRNDLLDEVWGVNFVGDPKIVDVNIRRIRQKVEADASHPNYLLTVWGYGYRWNDKVKEDANGN